MATFSKLVQGVARELSDSAKRAKGLLFAKMATETVPETPAPAAPHFVVLCDERDPRRHIIVRLPGRGGHRGNHKKRYC